MGSQKQSVGFLKITYGNRELYKVAKIKLMFTRVFDCKTKNLLMSEKTWSLASKNQFSKSWKQFVIFVFVPSLKGEHEIKIPFLSNNNTYNLYFQRNTFEMYLYFVYKGLEIIMTGSSFWTSMQKATELSWGLLFSRNNILNSHATFLLNLRNISLFENRQMAIPTQSLVSYSTALHRTFASQR